jgi:outer membrane lipoprotein LolB
MAFYQKEICPMKIRLLVFMCIFMVACQPSVKPANDAINLQRQVERELLLKKQDQWSFRGRLAVSDGNQAGTVKIRWQQSGEQFDIEISVPITNQKYRLRNVNSKVRLEGFGLVTQDGENAEAVLQQATGWRIPFQDMQSWLRGIRINKETRVDFSPAGLPSQFLENGWLIDYRGWDSASTPMPIKVFASSNVDGKSASVRLQVEAWEIP